jgi:hypothetical protein
MELDNIFVKALIPWGFFFIKFAYTLLNPQIIASLLNSGKIAGKYYYFTIANRWDCRFIFLFFKPNLLLIWCR